MWNKIKNIPSFVAAIIAVVSAVFAAGAWVTGYFATRAQLEIVRCISDHQEALLSYRIQSENAYAKYISAKVKLDRLNGDRNDGRSVDASQETELEASAKKNWDLIIKNQSRINELEQDLKSGKCIT